MLLAQVHSVNYSFKSVPVNKVSLEHKHVHVFMSYIWQLLRDNSRVEHCDRHHRAMFIGSDDRKVTGELKDCSNRKGAETRLYGLHRTELRKHAKLT